MDLTIVTAFHGRKELSKAFMWHLRHLRDATGMQLPLVFAFTDGSDFDNVSECMDFCDSAIQSPNRPLGKKWNDAVSAAFGDGAMRVMLLGSDDFASAEYVQHAAHERGDFVTLDRFTAYSPARGKAIEVVRSHPIYKGYGAGRVISSSFFRKCQKAVYDTVRNKGLDDSMEGKAIMNGIERRVSSFKGIGVVDVKTETNLHDYEEFRGSAVNVADVLAIMPSFNFAAA